MPRPTKRLHHPYHLKQLYASWRLRVLKHEHTGRVVHHQHTSYPVLALLLLATAVMLGHSTLSTYALSGDTVVSSVVSGPAPTHAATINSPVTSTTVAAASTATTGILSGPFKHLADLTVFGINIWKIVGSLWLTFGSIAAILYAFWLGEVREQRIILTRFRMKKL